MRSVVAEIKRHIDVYPGHPAVIALCILLEWEDDLSEAFKRGGPSNYQRYLTSGAIPGAGGNVSTGAHYLVEYMRGCLPMDVAIIMWNKAWVDYTSPLAHTDGYQKKQADGQRKADMLQPLLVKKMVEAKKKWSRYFGYFGI